MTDFAERIVRFITPCIIWVFCIFSCSEPDVREFFVKSEERAEPDAPYRFSLDLTDTSARYAMTLYMRLDCAERDFLRSGGMSGKIVFISPSGDSLSTDYVFLKSRFEDSGAFSKVYRHEFSPGFTPGQSGNWAVEIFVDEDSVKGSLRGVGLKSERIHSDGKR